MTSALSTFFRLNWCASRFVTPKHFAQSNVFETYLKIGTIVLSHPKVAKVADIAAGKMWQFPPYYKDWFKIELIGVDIDGDEMKQNAALDQRIVGDVVEKIPLPDSIVDFVMIHSGMEHFKNNERFLQHAFRILRPGGFLLAQFPSRYAPFAIANRLLPSWLKLNILKIAMGSSAEHLGFKAYYDRTDYSSFCKLCSRVGFKVIYDLQGYFSSGYFMFFFPLYVLSHLFDLTRFALGIRNLASYNLFLLQKPASHPEVEPLRLYFAWPG
jgi:SAM-dependent methyltransferase